MPSRTQADTCRQYVLPKLYAAGRDDERIAELRTFTDDRIVVTASPPYGVKFGSNFQPFVRKRAVKHNDDDDMTREPEMVREHPSAATARPMKEKS